MPFILSCFFAKWTSQNHSKCLRHVHTGLPWTCMTILFPEMFAIVNLQSQVVSNIDSFFQEILQT
jgi:hypothetical protein